MSCGAVLTASTRLPEHGASANAPSGTPRDHGWSPRNVETPSAPGEAVTVETDSRPFLQRFRRFAMRRRCRGAHWCANMHGTCPVPYAYCMACRESLVSNAAPRAHRGARRCLALAGLLVQSVHRTANLRVGGVRVMEIAELDFDSNRRDPSEPGGGEHNPSCSVVNRSVPPGPAVDGAHSETSSDCPPRLKLMGRRRPTVNAGWRSNPALATICDSHGRKTSGGRRRH